MFLARLFANPYLLLTLTTLIWGGNAIASRLAVGEVTPAVLVSFRWIGVVILVVLFARGPVVRDWPQLRRHLPYLLIMGTVGFTAFNTLFYIAAHSTEALNIGILQGSIPIYVLLGAFVAYRSPVSGLQMIGVAVTILGVILVAARGDPSRLVELRFNLGDLLMLIACALYAAYTVGLRRRPEVSGLAMFAAMSIGALVASVPLLAVEVARGAFLWPTPEGWAIIAFVVAGPSFLSQIFFMRGVELVGPGRAGVFVNLVPVFASGLSVLILGEHFAVYHGLALGLVLGGIALSERGKPKSAPAAGD